MRRALLCLLLAAAACDALPDEFTCTTSAMCRTAAAQGVCELDGHCSLPDGDCPYGRRFVDHSGAVSGQCVEWLPITWYGQERDYYDAPAAVRMALSVFLPDPPSQDALADRMTHAGLMARTLGTNPITEALNAYAGRGRWGTFALPDPPTTAQREALRSDLVTDLGAGFPIVCTVESGIRPPGYPPPPGNILHYVVAIGHRNAGREVLIADPGAEGKRPGFEAVPRMYAISTDDLAIWIGGWGYAAQYP